MHFFLGFQEYHWETSVGLVYRSKLNVSDIHNRQITACLWSLLPNTLASLWFREYLKRKEDKYLSLHPMNWSSECQISNYWVTLNSYVICRSPLLIYVLWKNWAVLKGNWFVLNEMNVSISLSQQVTGKNWSPSLLEIGGFKH